MAANSSLGLGASMMDQRFLNTTGVRQACISPTANTGAREHTAPVPHGDPVDCSCAVAPGSSTIYNDVVIYRASTPAAPWPPGPDPHGHRGDGPSVFPSSGEVFGGGRPV